MARGDHIKVTRYGRLYTHHGIDMGDGTVIHFAGEPLRAHAARVVRSNLEAFLKGGTLRVVRYRDSVRSTEAVVAAAEAQLSAGDYCMFRNNCEHFASYCKTGKMKSRQIRRLLLIGSAMATTGVVLGAAASRSLARRWSDRNSA
jgi:hypothetical protein